MKTKIVRIKKAELPAIKLPRSFWSQVGTVAEGAIIDNILAQRQEDGRPLKVNAKSTRDRKRAMGDPLLSLIGARPKKNAQPKRRLVRGGQRSWAHKIGRKFVDIVPAKPEVRKIAKYVQKMGYVGWFGLNNKAVEAIRALLRQQIKKAFK